MAVCASLRRPADSDFSPARSIFAWLGRGGAAVSRTVADPAARYFAASGWSPVAAGHPGAGIRSGLRLRDSLVRRELLLDLRHDAAVRGGGRARRLRVADAFLPLSRPLSWRFRPLDQSAGEWDLRGSRRTIN